MGEPTAIMALTLHQPWAALVAHGAKTYETRSWSTNHRGVLAIHAAKTQAHSRLIHMEPYLSTLPGGLLDYGKIVALCTLMNVVECTHERMAFLNHTERQFGDFSPGRFAWRLENVHRFQRPVPARGQQRLWKWRFLESDDVYRDWLQRDFIMNYIERFA
jgi:hypothetical protein